MKRYQLVLVIAFLSFNLLIVSIKTMSDKIQSDRMKHELCDLFLNLHEEIEQEFIDLYFESTEEFIKYLRFYLMTEKTEIAKELFYV